MSGSRPSADGFAVDCTLDSGINVGGLLKEGGGNVGCGEGISVLAVISPEGRFD